MNILAIETSCDETSVAIVRDGRHIMANVIASQIKLHQKYGGVVPELASRQHVVTILPVLEEAFQRSGTSWVNVDAIAVTRGPGLSPALLVGVNTAKAAAFARQKPLVAVNHIEGHVYSNWLIPETDVAMGVSPAEPRLPVVCLIVSGGHTELVLMTGHGQYKLLGKTVDDAAGEAFDKAARILGLGYPGGPAIQKAAEGGDPNAFHFPRGVLKGTLDFSFSGLKTALLRKVEECGFNASKPAPWQREAAPPEIASALGGPADVLTTRRLAPLTGEAAELSSFTSEPDNDQKFKVIKPPPARVLHAPHAKKKPNLPRCRGRYLWPTSQRRSRQQWSTASWRRPPLPPSRRVLARCWSPEAWPPTRALREALGERLKVPFRYPPLVLCTDNAAMIAAAAYYRYANSRQHDFTLDIEPNARFYV